MKNYFQIHKNKKPKRILSKRLKPDIRAIKSVLAVSELSYDGLPEILRKKIFEFDYSAEYIERAEKMVIACRKYIENELIPMLNL